MNEDCFLVYNLKQEIIEAEKNRVQKKYFNENDYNGKN